MTSKIVVNNIEPDAGISTVSILGIATATNFKTGTTNVHNVGVELAGINVLGADTPIGTGSTIYDDGGARFSGVVTATSFSGSGANLTGIDTDLVSDTSPQLGADLDVNNFNIKNGTAILDISTNQRFEFNVAGTEVVDINGGGVDITSGHLVLVDNVKAKFGSSGDMEIYHDGTDNYIRSNNGAIIIRDDAIDLKAY